MSSQERKRRCGARTGLGLLLAVAAGLSFAGSPTAPLPAQQPAAPAANEWRHQQGDAAHSRYVPTSIEPPLTIAWQAALSRRRAERKSLDAAAGGVLYHCGDRATALRVADGSIAWEKDTYTGFALATEYGLVFRSILDNTVGCLGAEDGELLWTHRLDQDQPGPVNGFPWGSIIRLASGPLLTSDSRTMVRERREPATGDLRNLPEATRLAAIDPETGESLGELSLDLPAWPGANPISPGWIGELPAAPGWVWLNDRTTLVTVEGGVRGRVRGRRYGHYGMFSGTVAAGEDEIYVVEGGRLRALDRRAMELWEAPTPVPSSYAVLAIAPRHLVRAYDNRLWVAHRRDGSQAWETAVGPPDHVVPRQGLVIAGEHLYVVASNPRIGDMAVEDVRLTVICYALETGERLWSWELAGWRPQGLIAHRGSLYVDCSRPPRRRDDDPPEEYLIVRLDPQKLDPGGEPSR